MALTVESNASLIPHHTLQLTSHCAYLVTVSNKNELLEAIAFAQDKKLPLIALGEGSNIVPSPFVNAVVCFVKIKGIQRLESDSTTVTVKVGAGEDWDDFVQVCLESGWYGLENLSLIPGSVGAAPIQNIGAYGVELKQFIKSVTVVNNATGKIEQLNQAQCQFGYRDSIFKQTLVNTHTIVSVTFTLLMQPKPVITYPVLQKALERYSDFQISPELIREHVVAIRQSKLPNPTTHPNAGSFFKNPYVSDAHLQKLLQQFPVMAWFKEGDKNKIAAGWLIDTLGLKGTAKGNIQIHDQQALVLINKGNADSVELLDFAGDIQQQVKEAFGIELEIEPRLLA